MTAPVDFTICYHSEKPILWQLLTDSLNGFSFGYTDDGKPGFREAGADSVLPFNTLMDLDAKYCDTKLVHHHAGGTITLSQSINTTSYDCEGVVICGATLNGTITIAGDNTYSFSTSSVNEQKISINENVIFVRTFGNNKVVITNLPDNVTITITCPVPDNTAASTFMILI